MPKFGIVGDNFGIRQDIPHIKIPTAFLTDESNMVTYFDGAIRRMKGRDFEFLDGEGNQVPVPDGKAIIHWHYHTDTNGTDYVFAYTTDHVYKWNETAWALMFTCSSACETWSSASFGKYVVSTNNLNLVQVWNEETPGTAFANLGSNDGIDIGSGLYLTRAAIVIVYESYLFLMNTYEDGVAKKYRRRWCSRGDITDFQDKELGGSGDAGSNDLDPSLIIIGAKIYSATGTSILITFTNKKQNAMALVTDEIVFTSDDIHESNGCLAGDSIVNDPNGNVYYLATDWTIRRVFDETNYSAFIDKTIKNINKTLFNKIRGIYISYYHQIWWAIPKDAASTGNDKIVRLNLKTMGWEPDLNIEVSSFGKYARQNTPNIDDIDELIDEYDVIIDSIENTEGSVYILIGDYEGKAFSAATALKDKGNNFVGSAVFSTDLADKKALSEVKRTIGAWIWTECEAVSTYKLDLEVRTQDRSSFEPAGSLNIFGNRKLIEQWLPFDFRGKVFEVRVSASNPFALCAIIFDFTYDGNF